ncbi:MAG: BrnT family toxin [Hyphomicrobiales bacterium]|nr:MAG: BrnT family toxin [Hyphomicrobiales bacterium]
MQFEWDEDKRREVLAKHGVDLLVAALIFEGPTLTRIDDRADYGEARRISLGLVDGEAYIVVHTERASVTQLITAWKGGRHEREEYAAGIARGHSTAEGRG